MTARSTLQWLWTCHCFTEIPLQPWSSEVMLRRIEHFSSLFIPVAIRGCPGGFRPPFRCIFVTHKLFMATSLRVQWHTFRWTVSPNGFPESAEVMARLCPNYGGWRWTVSLSLYHSGWLCSFLRRRKIIFNWIFHCAYPAAGKALSSGTSGRKGVRLVLARKMWHLTFSSVIKRTR